MWKGYCRLPLTSLNFHGPVQNIHRPPKENNVKHLEKAFNLEGCKRNEYDNLIEVTADASAFDVAFASAPSSVLQSWPQRWDEIPILPLLNVECLNGLHRKLAAERVLLPDDRWWPISLSIGANARPKTDTDIVEEYRNELKYDDGETFRKIRLYHRCGDKDQEAKWWARLWKSKSDPLRKLLEDEAYCEAFDQMIPWHGLWSAITIGGVRRLNGMQCREESLYFLRHIAESWRRILCNVAQPPGGIILDSFTVATLQNTSPSSSLSDIEMIKQRMANNSLFPNVTHAPDRSALLKNILDFEGMIPTLESFFQTLIYMEPCADILRGLLSRRPKKQSLREALFSSYKRPDSIPVQYRGNDTRRHSHLSYEGDRAVGYQQLWLFAMRNFSAMTTSTPKKTAGKARPQPTPPCPIYWHRFGALAVDLGFCTTVAESWKNRDGEREIAQQLLTQSHLSLDEKAVDQVAAILRYTKFPEYAQEIPNFTGGVIVPRDRRCGRPSESDIEHQNLFLPYMFARPTGYGIDITPFYCRWNAFRSFLWLDESSEVVFDATSQNEDIDMPDYSQRSSWNTVDQSTETDILSHLEARNISLEAKVRELDQNLASCRQHCKQQSLEFETKLRASEDERKRLEASNKEIRGRFLHSNPQSNLQSKVQKRQSLLRTKNKASTKINKDLGQRTTNIVRLRSINVEELPNKDTLSNLAYLRHYLSHISQQHNDIRENQQTANSSSQNLILRLVRLDSVIRVQDVYFSKEQSEFLISGWDRQGGIPEDLDIFIGPNRKLVTKHNYRVDYILNGWHANSLLWLAFKSEAMKLRSIWEPDAESDFVSQRFKLHTLTQANRQTARSLTRLNDHPTTALALKGRNGEIGFLARVEELNEPESSQTVARAEESNEPESSQTVGHVEHLFEPEEEQWEEEQL